MVDCCSAPGLTPFSQALEHLLAQISVQSSTQLMSIEQACGRVLAHDIESRLNIPSADNSAMDGYAMASDDAQAGKQLTMIAKVFAGHPFTGDVAAGQCVRIMTGGQVPQGCDCVIMQENTHAQTAEIGAHIEILQTAKVGENIRKLGEDIKVGQQILMKGRRLTPADIGLLASLGVESVTVFEPIKVALISTGDELKKPGQVLQAGQFYESNGYTVEAALKRFGADVINFGIVPDDLNLLTHAFQQADQQADVVITSGGVSVGEADYTKTVIEKLGRIDFWKLAIKPGKPFAFGHLHNSYFIGLPGNPVSALVTLHQLGMPMLRKLSGEIAKSPLRLSAILQGNIRKSPGRMDFQRGIFSIDETGQLIVTTTGGQGSGILTSMSQANCYIVLSQESGSVAGGERVSIEPFDSILS